MMSDLTEMQNINTDQAKTPPPNIGRTYIIQSRTQDVNDILINIKSVWSVVAQWGRWCDMEKGAWPSNDECVAALPPWYKRIITSSPDCEIENWINDLHDRAWIWWSSSITHNTIKIDLSVESSPSSFWMLEFVIEKASGEIVYKGDWIASQDS